ncbi:MAG: radical SAM-associated putative lipoprotein [Paludibacteraceae bacterium]|nr:radical SAM-associated putative lipoprotein [Paludibacteraceae bacterium]
MKKNRIYYFLLSLLGLQLTSCNEVGEDEYGCPYANFKVQGLVVSEKGEPLEDAKISVDLENTYEKNRNKNEDYGDGDDYNIYDDDYNIKADATTNSSGYFTFNKSETYCGSKPDNLRIITRKFGYKNDTTNLKIEASDYNGGKNWSDGTVSKKCKITLKKDDSDNSN